MNQQPDKLFKAKLENYQRPAPAGAWSRIESGLSKKNSKGFWLKIAASLLVVAIASYGILAILKKENSNQIVAEQKSAENPQDNKSNSASALLPSNDKSDVVMEDSQQDQSDQSTLDETTAAKVDRIITKTETHQLTTVQGEEAVAEIEALPENESVTINETVAQENTVKSYKLVVEAGEVNEKYLTKGTVAKATSEDENSSGIKKLLDKANDLKNNQDPFGNLRHMKNEILALNFQSNKKHEQNK